MPEAPAPGSARVKRPEPPAEPGRSGRLAAGAGAALVLCCVGHTLLLAFGFAGLGAAVGAVTGTTAVLIAAVVALAVAGALVAVRLRHRHRPVDVRRTDPGQTAAGPARCERNPS